MIKAFNDTTKLQLIMKNLRDNFHILKRRSTTTTILCRCTVVQDTVLEADVKGEAKKTPT